MTQIEMQTMTAIQNYCRHNTPSHKTVRMALASEMAKAIIITGSLDETKDGYAKMVAVRARILADALMEELQAKEGGEE